MPVRPDVHLDGAKRTSDVPMTRVSAQLVQPTSRTLGCGLAALRERLSIAELWGAFLLLATCLMVAPGCYRPSIVDGGLFCGPGTSCPEGFMCVLEHCYRAGADASRPDTSPETRADGSPDNTNVDAGSERVDAGGGRPERGLGETCDPINAGTSNRSDNCAAGLVCVDGNVGSLCFERCTMGDPCASGTACERRQIEIGGPNVMVCGLPATICSPVAPPAGCLPQRTCYLRGGVTICEISSGELPQQTACSYSRDCLPGTTCATGPGAGYCRRVCSGTSPCPSALTCQMSGNAAYGYCY